MLEMQIQGEKVDIGDFHHFIVPHKDFHHFDRLMKMKCKRGQVSMIAFFEI